MGSAKQSRLSEQIRGEKLRHSGQKTRGGFALTRLRKSATD